MTSAGGVPKKTSNKQIDGTMEGIKYIHLCAVRKMRMRCEMNRRGGRGMCVGVGWMCSTPVCLIMNRQTRRAADV